MRVFMWLLSWAVCVGLILLFFHGAGGGKR